MPISVSAFQSLQPLFAEDEEKLAALRHEYFVVKDPQLIMLSKHPGFPDRADYLPSRFFRISGERIDKDLASPADWNGFKDALSKTFREGETLAGVFAEPKPGPFFELLYFMELGQHYMIGPQTSEKLVADFSANRNQAEGLGGNFFQRYDILHRCFDLAAKAGAVCFRGP